MGDERAINYKTGKMPGARRNVTDTLKSLKKESPFAIQATKSQGNLVERGSVDPFG
jgi:hypothetical protein